MATGVLTALRTIPRITPAEWHALHPAVRWLIASRAAVLVMTASSAGIAGLVAWRDDLFDPLRFGLCMLGLLLAHATNNLLNDITDHARGVDRDNYFRTRYGPQPLEQGLMSLRQIWTVTILTGLPALLIGIGLALDRGLPVWILLGAGAFFVLFYTWPLKYLGLGEPAVTLVWGPLMIGGTYLVTTGQWSPDAVWIGMPYALAATLVLFGKHIDKLEADQAKGIRTLPVLLGHRAARWTGLGLVASQYGLVAWLLASDRLGWPVLAVLGASPFLRHLVPHWAAPAPTERPEAFPEEVWPLWYSAFAFVHTRRFGLLYLAGITVDVWLN